MDGSYMGQLTTAANMAIQSTHLQQGIVLPDEVSSTYMADTYARVTGSDDRKCSGSSRSTTVL